ncbi:MAG: flagellar M-ring protein FliF, partial [Deltaproteobacteria bacterium]
MDIKAIVEQVVALYKKLNRQQQFAIIGAVVVVIAFISFLVVYNVPQSKDDGFRPLYEGLSQKDAGLIVQQLEKLQIEYKIPEDGTIAIRKELVNQTRMEMATQGLPQDSKIGFELFDKQEFGATDFDQQIKFLRAKEGEVARTIEIISTIESAKVQIAIPKESVFIAKQTPPTASVIIKMKEGQVLSKRQVSGIKFLVAGAISKLSIENVKVIDEDGIPLGEEDAATRAGELA